LEVPSTPQSLTSIWCKLRVDHVRAKLRSRRARSAATRACEALRLPTSRLGAACVRNSTTVRSHASAASRASKLNCRPHRQTSRPPVGFWGRQTPDWGKAGPSCLDCGQSVATACVPRVDGGEGGKRGGKDDARARKAVGRQGSPTARTVGSSGGEPARKRMVVAGRGGHQEPCSMEESSR